MHFWDPSRWYKMCFECQGIKFQWKKNQNFHICLRSGPRWLTPLPPYSQPDRFFLQLALHNECVNFHRKSLNEWNYAEGAEITQEKNIRFCIIFWKNYANRKQILRPPVATNKNFAAGGIHIRPFITRAGWINDVDDRIAGRFSTEGYRGRKRCLSHEKGSEQVRIWKP